VTCPADAWNALADTWDAKIGDDGDELRRNIIAPVFDRWIPRLSSAKVAIDAGCGNGYLMSWLRRRGWQAEGLDVAASLLAHARRRNPNAALELADLTTSGPCAMGPADLVVCSMVLDGIADLDAALDGCRRLLNTGGELIVIVPHPCFAGNLQTSDYDESSAYQDVLAATWKFPGISLEVPYWRRPLDAYVNAEYITYVMNRSYDTEDRKRRDDVRLLPAYVVGIHARNE
jgi:SAM-dependent methyltransferase